MALAREPPRLGDKNLELRPIIYREAFDRSKNTETQK